MPSYDELELRIEILDKSLLQKVVDRFERFYFSGSNGRLSGVDFGNAHKPDLVILHGMRDHALSMIGLAEFLKPHYHVIIMDLSGHGQSDNPGSYSMTLFIADLRALVKSRSIKTPTLVGHSLGGHIACKYAAIYSDQVSKLVLLDGMGPPGNHEDSTADELITRLKVGVDTVLDKFKGKRMVDDEEALLRLSRNNPLLDGESAQLIVEHGLETHPEGGVRWRWDPAVQMVWHTFSNIEAERLWALVKCPVLIVTGENSLEYWASMGGKYTEMQTFYASELERRRLVFNNAQHKVIAGAGHMLHYDQPHQVNQTVSEFLFDTA